MNVFEEMDDGIDMEAVVAPQVFERELSEYIGFEDTGLKYEDVAAPSTWHVLVLPKQPKKMSAGGIALPDAVQQAEMHLNYIAQIVALGPLAGKNDKFLNPDWRGVKEFPLAGDPPHYLWGTKSGGGFMPHYVGEWVLLGRYSGQVITFRGVRLLTMNDDDILDGIKSPDGYRVWV